MKGSIGTPFMFVITQHMYNLLVVDSILLQYIYGRIALALRRFVVATYEYMYLSSPY